MHIHRPIGRAGPIAFTSLISVVMISTGVSPAFAPCETIQAPYTQPIDVIATEVTICEMLTVQVVPLPAVILVQPATVPPPRVWPIAIVPATPETVSVVPEIE